MFGFKYIVTVCDHSPLAGVPYNCITYEYRRRRAARKQMEEAFSMGHVAVIQRVDVYWESENEQ